MSAFRAYDIRGVYGKEIDERLAGRIAAWFSKLFDVGEAALGHDVRTSSLALKGACTKGLLSQGCDVIDLGLVPTPLLSSYLLKERMEGGIMVSASHNPPDHNGMKLYGRDAIDLTYETGIGLIEKNVGKKLETGHEGNVETEDFTEQYEGHLTSLAKIGKTVSIGMDCGNGCCSEIAPRVFASLGLDVKKLFCKYDGRFPNHLPDPSDENNISSLKSLVRKEKLDLGIAYDGDGDRAAFVDENGAFVRADDILRLYVRHFAKKGDKIFYALNCSRSVQDEIEEAGAKGIECRVGRSYMKQAMKKEKAAVGGELSGHFFFRVNHYIDDGILASLRLAEIVAEGGKLSELIGKPRYFSGPEMRLDCRNKIEVVKKVGERLSSKAERVLTIDGIKAVFPQGWVLLRASNTEEKISVRIEASGKKELQEMEKETMGMIKEVAR